MTVAAPADAALTLERKYANIVTRFMAFSIDVVVIAVLFAAAGAVAERMLGLLLGRTVRLSEWQLLYRLALIAWILLYTAYPLAVAGRTLGMSIVGLQAVRSDGSQLHGGRAVLRVAAFPLSFLLFGLGFILIVIRRDHRALHDVIAGTAVVYSWRARAAHLGFLAAPHLERAGHGQ